MKVLDLFCGGGGAARGYIRGGATDVIGVDIADHSKSYPGTFVQGCVLEYIDNLIKSGERFDLIHASPPCQGYSKHTKGDSQWVSYSKGRDEPKLIGEVRDRLKSLGVPYVIENVMGAKADMINPVTLCGTMFGLPISRHRLFETNWNLAQPKHGKCSGVAKSYATARGWEYRDMSVTGKGRRSGTSERWREILGIEMDAMTQSELAESIPPAYTKYICHEFLAQYDTYRRTA